MKTARDCSRQGFTLIEMIITLSVFLLLASAIFSIFGATLEGAGSLQDNQNREDEAQALQNWLRQSFLELPAEGVLVSYHREGRPFHVSGIIWGASGNLHALDLQTQANGNYTLRFTEVSDPGDQGPAGTAGYSLALSKFQTQIVNDDPGLAWRPLIHDLKSADWRFRAANATDWVDVSTAGKPVLAELTFQPAGVSGAIVDDFWVPPLQSAGNALAIAPPVPANQ